jgi:hypothetical protein
VKTRPSTRSQRRRDPIRTSADAASSGRLHSKVAAMAVERAVTELGIHASLSDIVAKAQLIENRILQSRSRRKPEQMC